MRMSGRCCLQGSLSPSLQGEVPFRGDASGQLLQMIARIWRGAVRADDAAAYAEYVQRTGIEGYRGTPGNRGAWLLSRTESDRLTSSSR